MSDDRVKPEDKIKEVKVNNKETETSNFEHRRKNFIKQVEKEALRYNVDIVAALEYGRQGVFAKMVVVDLLKKEENKTN